MDWSWSCCWSYFIVAIWGRCCCCCFWKLTDFSHFLCYCQLLLNIISFFVEDFHGIFCILVSWYDGWMDGCLVDWWLAFHEFTSLRIPSSTWFFLATFIRALVLTFDLDHIFVVRLFWLFVIAPLDHRNVWPTLSLYLHITDICCPFMAYWNFSKLPQICLKVDNGKEDFSPRMPLKAIWNDGGRVWVTVVWVVFLLLLLLLRFVNFHPVLGDYSPAMWNSYEIYFN